MKPSNSVQCAEGFRLQVDVGRLYMDRIVCVLLSIMNKYSNLCNPVISASLWDVCSCPQGQGLLPTPPELTADVCYNSGLGCQLAACWLCLFLTLHLAHCPGPHPLPTFPLSQHYLVINTIHHTCAFPLLTLYISPSVSWSLPGHWWEPWLHFSLSGLSCVWNRDWTTVYCIKEELHWYEDTG